MNRLLNPFQYWIEYQITSICSILQTNNNNIESKQIIDTNQQIISKNETNIKEKDHPLSNMTFMGYPIQIKAKQKKRMKPNIIFIIIRYIFNIY